ncbi:MAG TPA: hypothetical protein VGE98_15350 [Thermoanaerobaculia bacterium]
MARRSSHQLNAPTRVVWIIALVLGLAGILAHLHVLTVPVLVTYAFWLVAIAFGLLLVATVARGL